MCVNALHGQQDQALASRSLKAVRCGLDGWPTQPKRRYGLCPGSHYYFAVFFHAIIEILVIW